MAGIAPYLEQLAGNDDVRTDLARVRTRARGGDQELRRRGRRTRARRGLVLLVLAGGAAMAANQRVRAHVLDLAGGDTGSTPPAAGAGTSV